MKNITLAIDEAVLAKVRKYAAEHETTVNAIVREHLARLAETEDRAKQARAELAKLIDESTWDPGADWTWNRDDIYDRAVFPRHEHSDLRSERQPNRKSEKGKSG